jgi:uncharacterized coiled-coil protein SlyX
MSQLLTSASYLLLAIAVAIAVQRLRRLRLQLAETQLEAARLRRHMERLEMVLKQTEPEVFAQVKARSDMEWQQASARLAEEELPAFFPLEPSFAAITPLHRPE